MSESKRGSYAGKVSHQGAQTIKAPFPVGGKAKGGKVVKGDDLRTGRRSRN